MTEPTLSTMRNEIPLIPYTDPEIVEGLQDIAPTILPDLDCDWYTNGGMAIGIDWYHQTIIVCDAEHPDGAVIQTANFDDFITVFSAREAS